MCSCGRQFIIEHCCGMNVCRLCGVSVNAGPSMPNRFSFSCPARPPYSREKRFRRLLANVWGGRTSKCPQGLMENIEHLTPNSPHDIFLYIRGTPLRKHKRYDAVAHLSLAFLPKHKIAALSHNESFWATAVFREIESRHRRLRGVFPAYSWVIEQILKHACPPRPDLLPYVHMLACPKRRRTYEKRYGDLFKRSTQPSVNGSIRGDDQNTPQKLADHCALGGGYYAETLPWEIRAGHLEANPLSLVSYTGGV